VQVPTAGRPLKKRSSTERFKLAGSLEHNQLFANNLDARLDWAATLDGFFQPALVDQEHGILGQEPTVAKPQISSRLPSNILVFLIQSASRPEWRRDSLISIAMRRATPTSSPQHFVTLRLPSAEQSHSWPSTFGADVVGLWRCQAWGARYDIETIKSSHERSSRDNRCTCSRHIYPSIPGDLMLACPLHCDITSDTRHQACGA
jgi:hypothetical protein